MCSLDCQQDLALLSLPTVAWTLTLHVHDLLNDVYAVLATIVCMCVSCRVLFLLSLHYLGC